MLPNQRRPIGAVLSAAIHNGPMSVASPLSAASKPLGPRIVMAGGGAAVANKKFPSQISHLATIHENVARRDLGSARPVASILPRSSVPGPVVTKRLTFKPQFRNSTAMAPVT